MQGAVKVVSCHRRKSVEGGSKILRFYQGADTELSQGLMGIFQVPKGYQGLAMCC